MSTIIIPSPNSSNSSATIPIAYIRAILVGYQRYGADPANALRAANITQVSLTDPHGRVTATQMEIMSAMAMQELDDEALGWFSRRLPWGSYGMLCRASLASPNLGVALKRWCRHHRLLTQDIELKLTVSRSVASLVIDVNFDLGEIREFCLVTSLRYMLGYACWAVDSRIPLIEARFPYAEPEHKSIYPRLFPGAIFFDAIQAGFSFDAEYLELPLRRDENALQLMLQRAIPLTVLPYRRDRLLVLRVRQVLRSQAEEALTAEMVAERLHISVRTLHRQLQDEGIALQRLKDEVRRDRAIDLLNKTSKPVKLVAHAVGFRSEKSFSRAFRLWTGLPPSFFRRNTCE
ncbi:MAG: AraC family transcriptional regulator [Betaproteobacteria bacterium HGW-Betaproteobacteria-5]|nr:MAG: AraC family transcriptional regulator [Betaproteobacteria bacterium HGW-Betaproteobacteria-5]PKO41115.1 MAG: AraC family transcriptional regulator [Betaproteobacteria bacterium HGW-Betaproteobacteria-6]